MAERVVSRNIQEYLESIYTLTRNREKVSVKEIAENLGVTPASATKMLKRLMEKGFITHAPDSGVTLTETGSKIGAKISRRHHLLESFLSSILKIGRDLVHGEACEMEHSLSDETETALCRFLGHPSKSPADGTPIEVCDLPFASCEECLKKPAEGVTQVGKREGNLISVADLKEHDEGKVIFIRGDSKVLRRLLDMGITTNTRVSIVKVAPLGGPIEIAVRGSRLALGREIVGNIFLEVSRDKQEDKKR